MNILKSSQQQKICADGTTLSTTEWIYEPNSFRPMAQINTNHIQGTSALSYITPPTQAHPEKCAASKAKSSGAANKKSGDISNNKICEAITNNEDAANEPIECDLRYQGQIQDKETGLYYKRHRYYDPDSNT